MCTKAYSRFSSLCVQAMSAMKSQSSFILAMNDCLIDHASCAMVSITIQAQFLLLLQ